MTQQQIIEAGIDYTMQRQPVCIGALVSKDAIRQMHRNPSFEAGAQWTKKELIKEACEWLDNSLFEVVTGIKDISVMSYENVSLKEFIELFKKAMEEITMTREEQIKKQADIYIDDSSNYTEWFDGWSDTNDIELVEKAFIEGAKWADKHPNLSEEEQVGMGELGMIWQKKALIKKSCDWLRGQVYQEYSGGPFERLVTDEMIGNFKKAMEK